MSNRFPEGFRWGAATAAYQIEGAVALDGRQPSIWDTFSRQAGAILGGDTGEVACDHYLRYRGDVALMAGLGLQDYRFSVSWARVLPTVSGPANQAGLDFYSRLTDELLAQGIRPLVTLYHWDLPQTIQDLGGWADRDTAARFAEFTAVVAAELGDRVSTFTTLNEPYCSAFLGHASGEHAPGVRDAATALMAAHHLLLAHGLGVEVLRSVLDDDRHVSITLNPALVRSASDSAADRRAATLADLAANRMFLDPLFHGHLPDELVEATRAITDWSFVKDDDLELIGAPIDFLGVNYYTPAVVSAAPVEGGSAWPGVDGVFVRPASGPRTAMGWEIEPAGLTELLVSLSREFPTVPLVVTENGSAYPDTVDAGGRIDDVERARYLRTHIAAVRRAIDAGADVRGYLVWSLLDNFEWAWGYSQRFGIVHVDFETQQRRVKQSGEVYRGIIAAHGVADAES